MGILTSVPERYDRMFRSSYIGTDIICLAVFFMKAHRLRELGMGSTPKQDSPRGESGVTKLSSKPRITNTVILSTRRTMHHNAATIDSFMSALPLIWTSGHRTKVGAHSLPAPLGGRSWGSGSNATITGPP